jgi:hypothetical protein
VLLGELSRSATPVRFAFLRADQDALHAVQSLDPALAALA